MNPKVTRSVFTISGMDCPSEEYLIRMKLREVPGIHQLDFFLENHRLEVTHSADTAAVLQCLESLHMGAVFTREETADRVAVSENKLQTRVLRIVLAINAVFFLTEGFAGLIIGSMGLMADSLDMLADALVYGLSLYAVGRTGRTRAGVAKMAGYIQLFLAVAGFAEVLRRVFMDTPVPDFRMMILVSAMALAANMVCLKLLQGIRSRESHIRASMIFTSNDILANLGVIMAAVLVLLFSSPIPDLVIGVVVFILVLRGAIRILKSA